MDDFDFPIGAVVGCGLALLLLTPWWLWLAVGAMCAIPWYKKWRFWRTKLSEKKYFVDFDWWDGFLKPMMYVGTTQEGTLRWWYYQGYLYPQAIDNGEMYWDRKRQVTDPILLRHLDGFVAMGNEWPEYYKTVIVPRENKNKSKKKKKQPKQPKLMLTYQGQPVMSMDGIAAVPSNVPRADYAIGDADIQVDKYAKNAALASDAPMMNLINTVRELEEDATGKCPTIDFEGCAE